MPKHIRIILLIIIFIVLCWIYIPAVSGAFVGAVFRAAAQVWWLIAFWLLMIMFQQTWLFWRQEKMKSEIARCVIEIKIPREIRKTPRGMEQALYTIHQLVNAPNDFDEFYVQGEVTRWYSLEVVSFGGETHYYMWVYRKHRALIEAALVSYYPDLEVVDADDYVSRFPENVQEMNAQGYNCWGGEMMFGREDAYPIRTFADFEATEEEKELDPAAALLEVCSKLKPQEIMGIQFLIQPFYLRVEPLKALYPNFVEELKKKFQKISVESTVSPEGAQIERLAKAFSTRTPGETDILKAVEDKLSRPVFSVLIRFAYFSPKPLFSDSVPRRAMMGAFNQYADMDINYFVRNDLMSTRVRFWNGFPYLLPKLRNKYRQQRLLYNYRRRKIAQKYFMGKLINSHPMNWDFHSKMIYMTPGELATLYHPPTNVVLTAPHIPRVESRKYAPPAGMAIYGEQEEIEKFK